MQLYNATGYVKVSMVVLADDEEHALDVAFEYFKDAMRDENSSPEIQITGLVEKASHLKDGWDDVCLPYGGNGSSRIRDYLENK